MGKRKRKLPKIEDILERPWCYYCERDFEDLKLLISHQKAKHFKCDRCGRRLNTAGGLSVHMNQVHKETLQQVENALPGRQTLDVEIFGMEGVPPDIMEQHRLRIIQGFYKDMEERRLATGNPPPGQADGPSKRRAIVYESKEELLARLREWRSRKKAEREGSDGHFQQAGTNASPHQGDAGMPAHAAGLAAQPDLPQRPHGDVEGAARQEGLAPTGQADEAGDGERKIRKDKKSRLVYADNEVSAEEKMLALPRYAFVQPS
ncbi:hypothetical protein CDD81_7818 [Ophiocordyceps australis]|uniref:C2H2-type domain-containing protein n=1 Tax=Ophiocordyceps australis TaxID=1399860 RepID=A0A2C5Y9P7_9HYPO|nr:hypothetical protein CDD81_7818 [Ophiocordyceps australis]